ncbi:LysR family transcriptional regulator [Chitiniphilus purpureus]|uniref:LysR family transcriptional regulator n=1 Tax=Chitiniphilus purpureus TaxID=2981137 RepID=A0ABY6DRW0_9NEIS|nr:LysR family transcriptional regulator [Chitiniphilus sp. CD1]UXY17101.1 LysR family transcriptional regulator [Chitiniphilus sp. CD1]
MEIYQLRTFVAVALQGHLTQAAELLHLSQPAVTAQIKALEEELGIALFERYPGGVQLTEAGKLLLPDAQRILALSRDMLHRARGMSGEPKGKLRIGTIGVPGRLRLGPLLARLRQRYPLISVQTHHAISGVVLNDVRKKVLDGGFYLGRNPYQNLNTMVLSELRFCVAMPADWAKVYAEADWKALGQADWLGLSQFTSLSSITQELWREHNVAPNKVGEFDEEATLVEMLRAGIGLSILAERTAQRFAADGSIALWRGGETVIAAPLQFVYPAEREADPLICMLRDTLREVWELG